ncbi:hypothetical protein GCM10009609_37940 [Pseudonocardia aurantiaca]
MLGAATPLAAAAVVGTMGVAAYVWSDQFGLKIQVLGRPPDLADETVPLHGAGLDGGPVRGTVVGYLAGDTLVAVAGLGAAALPRARRGGRPRHDARPRRRDRGGDAGLSHRTETCRAGRRVRLSSRR